MRIRIHNPAFLLYQEFGVPRQRAALYDSTIITLPIEQLVHCLGSVGKEQLLPCLGGGYKPLRVVDAELVSGKKLPLVIRERDVRYQCGRAILYRRLLQAYPFRWPPVLTGPVHFYRFSVGSLPDP
jgi:TBC domain-containing protein kinase-like protein